MVPATRSPQWEIARRPNIGKAGSSGDGALSGRGSRSNRTKPTSRTALGSKREQDGDQVQALVRGGCLADRHALSTHHRLSFTR
jgi:hypothetical protein